MYKTGYASPVEVRQSPFHGRGLFAAVSATGLEVGRQSGAYGVLGNPWRSSVWVQPRVEQALQRVAFGTVVLVS